MNILKFHPPVWIRRITVKSGLYRELTSAIRTYLLNREYRQNPKIINDNGPISIIYMADGKVPSGGLGDRLWGIISAYKISDDLSLGFRINHINPFNIRKYLMPNEYDWEVDPNDISFNNTQSRALYYGESKARLNIRHLYSIIKYISKRRGLRQIHFYNNLHFTSNFGVLFNRLFKPTDYLMNELEKSFDYTGLERGKYIGATFRFQNLLGDFPETNFKPLDNNKCEELINSCIAGLEIIKKQNPNYKILVTSDSVNFMDRINNMKDITFIRKEILHPESGKKAVVGDPYIKSFVDLYMLSAALKVYSVFSGQMYRETQFAKTAAIIGNIEHKEIII